MLRRCRVPSVFRREEEAKVFLNIGKIRTDLVDRRARALSTADVPIWVRGKGEAR